MPEIANVIPGEPVADEWGNVIRSRTVQRYTGATQRTALHPTPTAGDLSFLADTGAVEVYFSGAWRAFLPSGVVLPFAGSTPPTGFLLCNGALVSRTTYAALFAAIGTVYGAGDGTTTFGLPDLRQRFPLGVAAAGTGSALGAVGGSIDHVHSAPVHNHTTPSHAHDLGATVSGGGGGATSTYAAHSHGTPALTTGSDSHSHTFSDTSGGPSSTSAEWNNGSVFSGASTSHTHSVSGTTSSDSHSHSVPAGTSGSAGSHSHTIPNHAHDLGVTVAGGGGTSGNNAAANTGTGNPPFLALHYIIRT